MCCCNRLAHSADCCDGVLMEHKMAHHYIESGLDNIWLENGFTRHATAYGDGMSIHDTDGLLRVIGKWLIGLPTPLNGANLRFLRLEMDLTQKALGAVLPKHGTPLS